MKKILLTIIAVLLITSLSAWGWGDYVGESFTKAWLKITGVLYLADGTAAAPSITFTSHTDDGFYLLSDGNIGTTIGGTLKWQYSGTYFGSNTTLGGRLKQTGSTAILPFVYSSADSDTGIGTGGANLLSAVAGGVTSQVWGTTVTLTAAQVNALRASPQTIVAAQGANTWIEPVSISITYDYGDAAFTVAAGEDFVIEWADGTDVTASIETTGFIDQADDEIRFYNGKVSDGADTEAMINQALRIFNTGAGETADGTNCELDIRITYRVYPTGL